MARSQKLNRRTGARATQHAGERQSFGTGQRAATLRPVVLTRLTTPLVQVDDDRDAARTGHGIWRWQRRSAPRSTLPGATVPRGGLGPRQLSVLRLGGLRTPTGMAAGNVVTATGFTRPHVYPLVERLTELGYRVPGPTRGS